MKVKELVKINYNKALIERAVRKFDTGDEFDINEHIISTLKDDQEKLKNTSNSVRLFDLDFEYTVMLFPCNDKTLLLYYTEEPVLQEHFLKLSYTSDYHYQDSSDRPDNISKEEWKKRMLDWEFVLGGNGWGKPIENGLCFTFHQRDVYFRIF